MTMTLFGHEPTFLDIEIPMYELTYADKIWNRACQGGGANPRAGDRALAALLLFHGAAMNGGVIYAAEGLSSDQLEAAQMGYKYFGFSAIADLLVKAKEAANSQDCPDLLEDELNEKYSKIIPYDETLVGNFENHLNVSWDDYSPIEGEP